MSSAVRCRRELFRELGTADTSGHLVVTSCTVSLSPPQQGGDLNYLPDCGVHHADTMRLSVQPTAIVHAESLPPADATAVCIPATGSRSARPARVNTSAAQLMTARSSHRTDAQSPRSQLNCTSVSATSNSYATTPSRCSTAPSNSLYLRSLPCLASAGITALKGSNEPPH